MKVALGGRKPAKLRLHSAPCTDQVENSAPTRGYVFGPVEVLQIGVGIQDAPREL